MTESSKSGAVTISRASVTGLPICDEGIEIARAVLPTRRRLTFAQVRAEGTSFDDLVWVAAAMALTDKDASRRLRLWMADVAARALHIYEKAEARDAMRGAIVAARKYARGEIDAAAWATARAAGRTAAKESARAATRSGFGAGVLAATWMATWVNASKSVWGPGWVAASEAAWDAERDAEKRWQFDRFILWFSDSEPEDWPLPDRHHVAS